MPWHVARAAVGKASAGTTNVVLRRAAAVAGAAGVGAEVQRRGPARAGKPAARRVTPRCAAPSAHMLGPKFAQKKVSP
jgi:hypothetical protein